MNCFRAKLLYDDSRLALIAVESLERVHDKFESGCWLHAAIRPVAVVVCDPGGTYVLGIDEGSPAIDLLIEDVPELDSMIASFAKR